MIRKFQNLKLKYKLVSLIIITLVIQIVFNILLNSVLVKNIFSQTVIQYANDNIINIKSNIDAKMSGINAVSQNIIYDKNIYNILLENCTSSDVMQNYEYQKKISNILKDMMYPQSNIKSISIYNNNYISYTADNSINSNNSINRNNNIEKLPDSLIPSWYYDDTGIWLFRTIYQKNSDEKFGVMVIKLKDDAFEINNQTNPSDGISLLISENEILELSKNAADNGPIIPYYEEIKSKNGSYIDTKNKLLVCFVSLKNAPWSVVYTTVLPVVYRAVNMANYLLILSGVISCIILIGFNVLLSRDLLNPINTLVGNIKSFENNDTLTPVSVERTDELGYLMKMFNKLIEHLEKLIKTVYVEKQAQDAAQIKALQAQINPHFLYNTLETINWLALVHNAKDISDMILSLSALMKANAGKLDKIITLDEELEYARSYCTIMHYRFGDELEFRYKIDDDVRSMYVPTLTLYPLIENSILHGTEKSDKKGIVFVHAFKENDNFILEVIDNGIGLDNSAVRNINSELENSEFASFEQEKPGEKSIGLSNTNKRIKLLFGSEYGIKVFSEYGYYCKMRCTFPINNKTGDLNNV